MSGYIYIIRRALQEHQNQPIYKIGKTENKNPFQYLKSRYDSGFVLYHIIKVSDASAIESRLIDLLNSFPEQFKLVDGRETFELLGNTDVYDIADIILDVIGEYIEIQIDEEKISNSLMNINLEKSLIDQIYNDDIKIEKAKQILKKWFDDGNDFGLNISSNRDFVAWLDYPIVKTAKYDSVDTVWDELLLIENDVWYEGPQKGPDRKKLIELGLKYSDVLYDIDIVIFHKGRPKHFIMIMYEDDQMLFIKREILRDVDIKEIFQISPDWILEQKKIPQNLKYKVI